MSNVFLVCFAGRAKAIPRQVLVWGIILAMRRPFMPLAVSASCLAAFGCNDPSAPTVGGAGPLDAAETEVSVVQNPRSCQVSRVSAGKNHTCAVLVDGRAFCWGANEEAQLGVGDLVTRPLPIAVLTPKPLVEVRASNGSTCARTTDNQILCWGRVAGGVQGTPGTSKPTPVVLPGNSAAVATGGDHACALLTDARVFCWGRGGLVGDGTMIDRATPVVVEGLPMRGSSLVATFSHTCLRTTKAELLCWGNNDDGALGISQTSGLGLAPVAAAVFTFPSASVAVGPGQTCVITGGEMPGRVWCTPPLASPERMGWGANNLGITVGQAHACTIDKDLKMRCAGANDQGQVGPDPRLTIPDTEPLPVLTDATFMSAGVAHTCAIRTDRTLWCWGRNTEGQLGIGTMLNTNTPTPVVFPAGCPLQ